MGEVSKSKVMVTEIAYAHLIRDDYEGDALFDMESSDPLNSLRLRDILPAEMASANGRLRIVATFEPTEAMR